MGFFRVFDPSSGFMIHSAVPELFLKQRCHESSNRGSILHSRKKLVLTKRKINTHQSICLQVQTNQSVLILFYSRIKGNVVTSESFNHDIIYLFYDPFLPGIFYFINGLSRRENMDKIILLSLALVRERACDLGKRKYPFCDFASSFAKQEKQSPITY